MKMKMNLEDVLDDLCARFIINLPEEERCKFERLGFQIEQAFWFYDDFYRPSHPHLPRLNLRSFGQVLLQRYPPLMAPFGRDFDRLYEEFMAYKHAIPVCGALILNESLTKCLLVKGWNSKSTWGFPKGKIGKDEDPADCAIREVFEETGFDISSRISSNNYIDAHSNNNNNANNTANNQQSTRLFIIPGVPESTQFIPQTRKEISKIQWHLIEKLPTKYGQDNSFYNVVAFVKKLKHWIKTRGAEYKKQSGNKTESKSTKKKKADNNNGYNTGFSNTKSPKKQGGTGTNSIQDIFDKLRLKNDHSPVNSVMMRDNPSPIHLFEKMTVVAKTAVVTQADEADPKAKIVKALEDFALALKALKVNRSVVRESVNKFF